MLSLARGGPTIWLNDKDAKAAGIEDNDWVEFWNANGAMVARAILTSRMPEGLSILQHATEKIMNTPASNVTGIRGGDHNSPTRVVINPTHMIGIPDRSALILEEIHYHEPFEVSHRIAAPPRVGVGHSDVLADHHHAIHAATKGFFHGDRE